MKTPRRGRKVREGFPDKMTYAGPRGCTGDGNVSFPGVVTIWAMARKLESGWYILATERQCG